MPLPLTDAEPIARPCRTCGARDRYPSGGCRPCGRRRNAENTEYFKNRNADARAEAIGQARVANTRSGVIYGLFDLTGALRYIGQTQVSPRRRLSQHLHAFKGQNRHLPVNRWIEKLAKAKAEPEMRLLAGPMPVAALDDAERLHIAQARARGMRLLNVSEGGATHLMTRPMPEDAIRRSAEAKRGKPRPPEVRAKLSAANMGKKPSAETLAKRSIALSGKKQSPEWIRKRAEAVARTKALNQRDACSHGHKWTKENTRWYRGHRNCRACAREQTAARRAAAREAKHLQVAA
jgi:hypothetical protein